MPKRTDYVLKVEPMEINLSPVGFRLWARQHLQCRHDFQEPNDFSHVPYFLLCRAIELALKAEHLETMRQRQVKIDFGHDLLKSYSNLPRDMQILSQEGLGTLGAANAMYKDKGFEYFSVIDACTGFKRAPDVTILEAIAVKLLRNYA